MILAAESTLFGRVTDLDHEIDEILDREDRVVEDRVLRVDSLDKRPIFTDELNIVRIHPEVGCVHQVEEELLAQLRIVNQKTKLSEQLYGLAIHWGHLRIADWQSRHRVKQELKKVSQVCGLVIDDALGLIVSNSLDSKL